MSLQKLPQPVQSMILCQVPLVYVARLAATCKALHKASMDDSMWAVRYARCEHRFEEWIEGKREDESWREAFARLAIRGMRAPPSPVGVWKDPSSTTRGQKLAFALDSTARMLDSLIVTSEGSLCEEWSAVGAVIEHKQWDLLEDVLLLTVDQGPRLDKYGDPIIPRQPRPQFGFKSEWRSGSRFYSWLGLMPLDGSIEVFELLIRYDCDLEHCRSCSGAYAHSDSETLDERFAKRPDVLKLIADAKVARRRMPPPRSQKPRNKRCAMQ